MGPRGLLPRGGRGLASEEAGEDSRLFVTVYASEEETLP